MVTVECEFEEILESKYDDYDVSRISLGLHLRVETLFVFII